MGTKIICEKCGSELTEILYGIRANNIFQNCISKKTQTLYQCPKCKTVEAIGDE